MYRFSRSIYREIAPKVVEDEHDPTGCRNKQQVLDACEGTIRRLTLFNDVRTHFAIGDQLAVWRAIELNIELAQEFLARLPEGAGLDGIPRQCRAHTRKGTPCQREPLPGRDYCPSHKHLEESTTEVVEVAFEELGREPIKELTAA